MEEGLLVLQCLVDESIPSNLPPLMRAKQKFKPMALSTVRNNVEKVSAAVTPLTLAQLDDASDDDDDEGCHLGVGEDVLHAGAPLHVGRVDECQ